MSLLVQRQEMSYFVYRKSQKPPKKALTIFLTHLAPKTGNA